MQIGEKMKQVCEVTALRSLRNSPQLCSAIEIKTCLQPKPVEELTCDTWTNKILSFQVDGHEKRGKPSETWGEVVSEVVSEWTYCYAYGHVK